VFVILIYTLYEDNRGFLVDFFVILIIPLKKFFSNNVILLVLFKKIIFFVIFVIIVVIENDKYDLLHLKLEIFVLIILIHINFFI